jgi:putative Mg2+ transporter-C (MgtC) family protein
MNNLLAWDISYLLDGAIWLRLAVAVICGVVVGLERQRHHKEAGLRTMMLISLGSALYVIIGRLMAAHGGENIDPTRIAGQIVTGIGFLGAGVIIQQGLTVRGLTTAATIWTVAAVGALIGAGYPLLGLAVTLGIVVMLMAIAWIEHRFLQHGDS